MKKIYILLTTLAFIGLSSCNTDDLEPTLNQNKIIEVLTVQDVYGLIKGAYNEMTSAGYYGRDFIVNNEVRSDNCFSNGNSGRFTTQASFAYLPTTGFMFDDAYRAIAPANIIINTDISALSGDTAYGMHLQGQAYAVRALAHFDMLKQYGQQHVGGTLGVPYVKEFYGEDLVPARNTITENIADIYSDLETAFSLMDDNYFDSSKQFMSKYTAKALESRVATYFGDWPRVVDAAEEVINSNLYSIMTAGSFVGSWASGGQNNSIFELAFGSTDNRSSNSLAYIYRRAGQVPGYGDVQVIDGVEALFEPGDVRGDILGYEDGGVTLRNIGKYPNNQGYDNIVVMRYEEVILNYAEALFEINNADPEALTQLNNITSNRGATPYVTVTKENILNERRKELMFEGFRFDDLVRTGQDIEKVSLQQNFSATIPYGDYRLAWPIPESEILSNPNMEQNQGY